MTQEQLAERIEVSPQFVSDAERGIVGVSLGTLKRICLILGVSSDQLLFGSDAADRVSALAERCSILTEEQFSIILELIDKAVLLVKTDTTKLP